MRDLAELKINENGSRVTRPAPSNDIINAFQIRYGITLPKDYLLLLHHSNGGHPELDSIEPVGRPGAARWAVDRFYHLGHGRESAGSLWLAMEKWRPILGHNALPFAEDGGGNQFFIDLETTLAAVKVCVHDESFLIVDVAPSFQAFLDGLSTDSDMI